MKQIYYTAILSIFILLAPAFSYAAAPGSLFRVTRIPDGAGLIIRVKSFAGIPLKVEHVRLIGIDLPESGHGQWRRQAKKKLKKIIGENGWTVNVEYDLQQRDREGRLLVYAWNRRGELINEKLLEAGYAVLNMPPPNLKYAGRLAAAQKKAQADGAGLWERAGSKK